MNKIASIAIASLLLIGCNDTKEVAEGKSKFGETNPPVVAEEVIEETAEETEQVNTGIQTITWFPFEEGVKRAQREKKKVFVDVYTDWCGWCKKMDATTFIDPAVISYMNEKYIAVKFNAEQKSPVSFLDEEYVFVNSGKRGYHQLAAVLLDNQMGYPSFAVLDSKGKRLTRLVGYQQPQQLIGALKVLEN